MTADTKQTPQRQHLESHPSGASTGAGLGAPPDPARLRQICWDIGTRFPVVPSGHRLIFTAAQPRLGYLHWCLDPARLEGLRERLGLHAEGARLVVRVYDVTDIIFDGFNAHRTTDVDITGSSGRHYLRIEEPDRNLLAEVGLLLRSGAFHPLARSTPRFFDRDRPSQVFELGGLYVGKAFDRVFPVTNVLDAPVFEQLRREIDATGRRSPLRLAEVDAGVGGEYVGDLVRRLSQELQKLGVEAEPLALPLSSIGAQSVLEAAHNQAQLLLARFRKRHSEAPFELIHCHDWYSVGVGLPAARAFGLPWVVTLHSTEHERAQGKLSTGASARIAEWERRAVAEAALIIVPHLDTKRAVLEVYGSSPERVLVIGDHAEDEGRRFPDPGEARQALGLRPDWPVVLFAGELSYPAGADILVDAVPTVCRDQHTVHFVFAGEGPLRWDLERRVHGAGLGHRCRFLGDVPSEHFEGILMGASFVVIPARTWQGEGLAQLAVSFGKPVLTTQQAQIYTVQHGQTGLITHDNPGSIVWGIKELLANPLRGNMMRLLARRKALHGLSFDRIAVEHYLAFSKVLRNGEGLAVA